MKTIIWYVRIGLAIPVLMVAAMSWVLLETLLGMKLELRKELIPSNT